MAKRKIFSDVWKLINIASPDECWEWMGCKSSRGYGNITMSQKSYLAHRIVYFLSNPNTIEPNVSSDVTKKDCVLHKCDNSSCCNPAHLFLGNRHDNNQDAKQKGRAKGLKGHLHPRAKLSQDQAEQIRLLHGHSWSYVELGNMFGVHANSCSRICKGIAYQEARG